MISDEFNSKIWIYFETNLKPRTRKEYFKIINDFNKEIGHDPLTLTSKEAKQYYNYLLNKMEHNLISYSTGVMRLSVIRSICNFIEYYNINHGNKYINYFKEYSLPEPDRLIDEKGIPMRRIIKSHFDIFLVLCKASRIMPPVLLAKTSTPTIRDHQ